MSLRIQRLVCRRRKTWNGQAKDGQELPGPRDAVWGLALSGGGIRSATFCFGLMQAFAIRKMLLRFDLLSTVSGGSYIGAMWGRLLQRAQSFDDVRRMSEALASSTTTWLSWWLRANGRYLMPRGTKDRLFALAVYLRNLLGIHAELGVIGLLLGTALAAFDLGVWSWLDTQSRTSWPPLLDAVGPQLGWLPTPWLLLIPLLAVGTLCIIVYWALPLVAKSMLNALIGMVLAALLIAVLWAIRTPWMGSAQSGNVLLREVLWSAAVFFSACWILALPIARVLEQRALCRHAGGGAPAPSLIRHLRAGTPGRYWSAQAGLARAFATAQAQDEARSRTTKWLYGTLYAAAAVLLLGTLDRFAWWLAFDMRTWLQTGLGLAVIAAALRALMPLMKLLTPGGAGAASLLWVGSVLGRLLTFCLSAWWVAVVQKTALGLAFEAEHIDLGAARNPLLLIGGLALAYALVTGWNNVRFLNLSSLHGFYRARLVRSYLGASNPDRFPAQAAHDPLNAVRPLPNDAEARDIKAVADVDPSDDLPIHEYKPHAHGGPIHLINACLNETRDPRGGLFNRDRRGRVVTIGPEGILRVSQQHWRALTASIESLTLGSWMAISGAAVAPGLGKATRGGIPALAMFTGARLGYWWDSTAIQGAKKVWRVPPVKLRGLLRETLGVFGGQEVRDWFMTDGGHFENTGAYALLVERCPLIVVADCGADPGYRFEDLENLVRKARIDLGAEITFLRPRTDKDGLPGPLANPMPKAALDLCSSFGSLNDLASPDNCACFALAAIDYAARAGQPQRGYLLLVKPNLCSGLPVDLVNFRAQHPAFPQQSTADQFFDEAQWESYFQLGKELGLLMSVPAIEALIARADDCFVRDNGSPIEAGSQDGQATAGSAAAPGRIPARIATSAVKTSIGLGAAATMGVAVWQAIDGMRNSLAEEAKEEKAALKEMTDVWGALRTEEADPGKSREAAATAARLAAILARVSDTLCRDQDADWFNRSPLAVDILHGARDACSRYSDSNMPSCGWLLNMSDPFAAGPRASCLTAGVTLAEISGRGETCTPYWGYDYRRDALPQCAHPNDPMAQARLAEVRRQRAVAGVEVLPAHVSLPEARDGVCAGVTLAPRVHSQDDKEKVNAHIPAWLDTGVRIAATESLSARARMAGLAPPVPSPVTRLQYHANVPRACALQLAQAAQAQGWAIEPAPPKFRSLPGHVELWMQASARPQTPPAAAPAASQASAPMLNVTAIVVAAPCAATQACCPSRPVAQTRRIRKPPAAPEKDGTASKTTAETPSPADGTTCPQTAAAAPAMPAASAY